MKRQLIIVAKVAMIYGIIWSSMCFGMDGKDCQNHNLQPGGYAATVYQQSVVNADIGAFPVASNFDPNEEQRVQQFYTQAHEQLVSTSVTSMLQQQINNLQYTLNQSNEARRYQCDESEKKLTALREQLKAQKEIIDSLSKSITYLQGKQDGMVAGGSNQTPLVITQNNSSTAANSTAVETHNNNDTETYYKALRNEGILASIIIIAALCKTGPVGGVGAALLLAGGGCYKHKSVLSEIIRKFRVISGCFVVAVGSMGVAMLANDKDMTAACFVIAPASLFVAAIYGAAT